MSDHRDPRISLPNDVSRCTAAAAPCAEKLHCARYMAAMPANWASVTDYSNHSTPCARFISVEGRLREQAHPAKQPATVHPALPGIGGAQ